jgi:hypothetical protein
MAIIQNMGNRGVYSLGSMSVPVSNTVLVFVVKIVAVLFWTWILNLMCKDGHKEIAWFLVLLPFVLLFFMMGTMEGFIEKKTDDTSGRPPPPGAPRRPPSPPKKPMGENIMNPVVASKPTLY